MSIATVAWWYRNGLFESDEEARGAFRLALQQWLYGIGDGSASAWMGLSEQEFNEWCTNDALPPKSKMSAGVSR